jgi:hypothetical protein
MRNDNLDQALDAALAQYSSAEPLAGLEQRVLNRVRAAGRARRIGPWVLAVGLAVVVVVGTITTAVVWKRPLPQVGQAFRPVQPRIQTQAAPAGRKKRLGQARRPVPLTNEERALLAFVTRAPDQAREALLDLQRRSTEPIQVEEIKIKPLRSDDAK